MRAVVLVIAVALATIAAPARATPPGCTARNFMTGCATAAIEDFRGAIIVPGSEAANRAVATSHGCDGCVWTLVIDCDRNSVDSPSYVTCNAARCADGTAYRIYLQRPDDANPAYVDTVCLSPTRRIVTAADLATDVERYLTNLRPPPTTIRTQPDGRAVVRLATFFLASGPATDATDLDVTTAAGPARLGIDIAPGRYVWSFGDGATCETAEAGAPYNGGDPVERCDDRVAHVFTAATTATVTLRATWRGTYTFDVGYGPVGPMPIPGAGVAGPTATRTVVVREARAELIGN